MNIQPVTSEHFRRSVVAVPPLARRSDLTVCPEQNRRIIRRLEGAGISLLLYGGNAVLHHVRLSEYEQLLEMLETGVAADTTVIPSVGPSWGMMMDQADILRHTSFPTVMVLPRSPMATEAGFQNGFRRFVERAERPAVLYLKDDRSLTVSGAAELVEDGLVSFIKYAIVRPDPADDRFLSELTDRVSPDRICSGIGEQPALIHLTTFRCVGYTSGCVRINPALSQAMLRAIQERDYDRAEQIRRQFEPLEQLRNSIHPVRVLHEAVREAEIAETGPIVPFLSGLAPTQRDSVRTAARRLRDIT